MLYIMDNLKVTGEEFRAWLVSVSPKVLYFAALHALLLSFCSYVLTLLSVGPYAADSTRREVEN